MEEPKKIIEYNGRRYYYNKGYYYFTERLHRRMWEDAYGPIPEDHHIHHKNGNSADNRLENLECIPKREHHLLHFDVEKQLKILHSPEVSEKAHRWHKTKEGRRTLGEYSKKQWLTRDFVTRKCVVCLKEHQTKNYGRSKYCSQKCRTKAGYWARIIGMNCVICAASFRAEKGRSRTCSSKCAGALSSLTKGGMRHDVISPVE